MAGFDFASNAHKMVDWTFWAILFLALVGAGTVSYGLICGAWWLCQHIKVV